MNTYTITYIYFTSRAQWNILKVERRTEAGMESLRIPKAFRAATIERLEKICQAEYGEGEYIRHVFNVCDEERHDIASATFYSLSRDGKTCFVRCPCGRMRHVKRELIQTEKVS